MFAMPHITKKKRKTLKYLCIYSCSKGMLKTTLLSFIRTEVLAPSKDSTGRLAAELCSADFFALTRGLSSHISSKFPQFELFEFWCVSEISYN